MKNLWPDKINESGVVTPRQILHYQSEKLTEITNLVLQGSISSRSIQPSLLSYQFDTARMFTKEVFRHRFRISAARLDYSFTLLTLVHETLKPFPFEVLFDLDDKIYRGDSPEDLEAILAEIFGSETVQKAFSSLLDQSK